MEDWLMLQNFYESLTAMSKGHVDAAAGGAFLSLSITNSTTLIEKMVANQSWEEERKTQKGTHSVKEADLLATKIDLLMKKLDDRATNKDTTIRTVQAMDSHMTCKVYGDVGQSGNNCPETREEASYINNRYRQPQGNNGWNNQSCPQRGNNFNSNFNPNQPSLKDLVFSQAKLIKILIRN
jgi:hypothetical protein